MRLADGERRVVSVVIVLAAFLIISGCPAKQTKPTISVLAPWARMASTGENSGAFFGIRNDGAEPDRLLAAESPVAMMVELHRTMIMDDVASMSPVDSIEAPAKGLAELKPGGFHVMLIDLKQDLKPGDKITLILVFEKSGRIQVSAEIRNP